MCDIMTAFIEKRKGSLDIFITCTRFEKTVQKNIIVINIQKGSCTVVDLKKKKNGIFYTLGKINSKN